MYKFSSEAFTLVELLVAISVIGILAGVILVAIDPGEQMAKARDAGRKNTLSQLSKAVQAYYISKSTWPPRGTAPNTWMNSLVTLGDIKIQASLIGAADQYCFSNTDPNYNDDNQNNYCYIYVAMPDPPNNLEAEVFVKMEGMREKQICKQDISITSTPFWAWHSFNNKTCMKCSGGAGYIYINTDCHPRQ